LTDTNIS